MSFYEELLTLGQHLHERERLALYKFLVESKSKTYKSDALKLINSKELISAIANGEIIYTLNGNKVSYSARRNGTTPLQENIRTLKLSNVRMLRINKLIKFFAQTEVEVIWNFPLQGKNLQGEGSYCTLLYPYFDLRYFSKGKNRIFGLINKIKTNDKELLTKLRTL